MKKIVLESIAVPDVPGYPDKVAVFDEGNAVIYHNACSACPNYREPIKAGEHVENARPWEQVYGWLACGRYRWECVKHEKYGKCLLLNSGSDLPSRTPNPRHDGRYVLSQIFFHSGQSPVWRGSAGCITLPPDAWPSFIELFSDGETGDVAVVDAVVAQKEAPTV